MVLNSFIGISFPLGFNSKQAVLSKFLLLRVDSNKIVFLVHNGNKVMTEKLSFNDNSDFYHEILCSTKRIVVASVKTYETTGTYITLRLFKKDSEELRFNQRITLSAAEFDLLGQKIKTIQDLSSRGTAKKNKRKQRSGCESDLEERTQCKSGRAKKSRQKITNKASESDKEN